MSVVARFAPSPTGIIHIGGGQTSLFNCFSVNPKGKFSLFRDPNGRGAGASMLKKRARAAPELADRVGAPTLEQQPAAPELAGAPPKPDLSQRVRRLRDCLAAEAHVDPAEMNAALKGFATEAGVELGRIESGQHAPHIGGAPAPRRALNLLSREEGLAQVGSSLRTRSCKAS